MADIDTLRMVSPIEAIWARAAINVALRPGSSKFAKRELAHAARIDPSAIAERIELLEAQIELLRAALSAHP